MSIENDLISGMFRDNLRMAERMRSVGDFTMARAELNAAMQKLGELEKLAEVTPAMQPRQWINAPGHQDEQ